MTRAAGVTARAPWLLLALCLTLGASFRLYHLDRQSFWYDEMFTRFWATGQSWADVRERIPTVVSTPAELQRVLTRPPGRGPRDVIRSIGRDDPQHTPLYYLIAQGWIRLFGDSVWTLRALSVLIGMLTLPCVYWLCRELELGLRTSYIAPALASVSPFFVIYSQEARQYGLYGAEVLVASALMLRAARTGRARDWLMYGFALVAGLYTHLLFATVVVAHALLLVAPHKQPPESPGATRSAIKPFLVVALLAVVALLPWLSFLLENSARAASHLRWSAGRVSLPYLLGMWAFNYSAVFVDGDHSLRFVETRDLAFFLDYGFRCAALALIGMAVLFVWRHPAARTKTFVLALIFVPLASLALPDLVLGGIRSGGGHRYLFPSYIGVVLAVSWLLGDDGLTGARFARARVAALYAVVGCAVVSLAVHANARTWWTKPVGYQLPRIARIVGGSPQPLLIAPASVDMLTMSTLLEPTVRVLPVRNVDDFTVPDGSQDNLDRQGRRGPLVGAMYSALFVLGENEALMTRLRGDGRFDVVSVDSTGQLWELRRRSAPSIPLGGTRTIRADSAVGRTAR